MNWRSAVVASLLVVLVAATTIYAESAGFAVVGEQGSATPAESGESEQADVETVAAWSAACPRLMSEKGHQEVAHAISLPGFSTEEAGSLSAFVAGQQVARVKRVGQGISVDGPTEMASVTAEAKRSLAPGAVLFREYQDLAKENRGLSVALCPAPAPEFWFAGLSASAGTRDLLMLHNPTRSPAVVDVEVIGADGVSAVPGDSDIVLPPGAEESLAVDALVPGAPYVGLRIVARTGVFSASVLSTRTAGLLPLGAAFIPAVPGPGTRLVMPSVPTRASQHELLITAPQESARASVSIIGSDGRSAVAGVGAVSVEAGGTTSVDLTDELAGSSVMVEVDSDVPVLAIVRSSVVRSGPAPAWARGVEVEDVAFSAPARAVGRASVLPLGAAEGTAAWVRIGTVDQSARVRVSVIPVSTQDSDTSVKPLLEGEFSIALGSSEVIKVKDVKDNEAAVVLVEQVGGGGSAFAGIWQRVEDREEMISAWPSQRIESEVSVPQARQNPQLLSR